MQSEKCCNAKPAPVLPTRKPTMPTAQPKPEQPKRTLLHRLHAYSAHNKKRFF